MCRSFRIAIGQMRMPASSLTSTAALDGNGRVGGTQRWLTVPLLPGTTYTYRVRAVNTDMEVTAAAKSCPPKWSEWSGPKESYTTPANVPDAPGSTADRSWWRRAIIRGRRFRYHYDFMDEAGKRGRR